MDAYEQYDIRSASFDEFVDFLFDHDVVPTPSDPKEPGPWYWHAEVAFDPIRVAGFYIRLFQEPRFLIARFSIPYLEQGFWAIQSGNLDCAVSEIIWHRDVPLEIRESCIRTMFHLFEKLFATCELDTAPNMWWDSLAYDWHCGNRDRANGREDELMQDVMFGTLERILSLPSRACHIAALHGLGHLHHPETEGLVQSYIERNEPMDSDLRAYAQAAARFEVM
jgi:hypothetical protein